MGDSLRAYPLPDSLPCDHHTTDAPCTRRLAYLLTRRHGVPHAQRVLPAPLRARRAPPLRAYVSLRTRTRTHPSPRLIYGQLYLDERHLEWMSDRVLQYVLLDLRPLCVPPPF